MDGRVRWARAFAHVFKRAWMCPFVTPLLLCRCGKAGVIAIVDSVHGGPARHDAADPKDHHVHAVDDEEGRLLQQEARSRPRLTVCDEGVCVRLRLYVCAFVRAFGRGLFVSACVSVRVCLCVGVCMYVLACVCVRGYSSC